MIDRAVHLVGEELQSYAATLFASVIGDEVAACCKCHQDAPKEGARPLVAVTSHDETGRFLSVTLGVMCMPCVAESGMVMEVRP